MQKSTKVNAPFYGATCKEMEGEVLETAKKQEFNSWTQLSIYDWRKDLWAEKNFNGNTFFRKHCKKILRKQACWNLAFDVFLLNLEAASWWCPFIHNQFCHGISYGYENGQNIGFVVNSKHHTLFKDISK